MVDVSKLFCEVEPKADDLRYREDRSPFAADRRPVVVWNCTPACNLKCRHCYAAQGGSEAAVLTGAEARRMMDDLAAFGVPVLLFSGGEPCLREDLVNLVAYARAKGIRPVLSTNGTLLTRDLASRLAEAGLAYAGVSFDGVKETHDAFRGVAGSFDRAQMGLRNAREAGLKVGLRLTLNRANAAEIPAVFDLMKREGVRRACFYHLVYAGRGAALAREDLSPEACRAAVRQIITETRRWFEAGERPEILTVDNHADGPFVCLELAREDPARAARALDLLRSNGGNASGRAIGCIGWDGAVYADQFWRHFSFGNVRERPFSEIWCDTSGATEASALMGMLKDKRPHLKGRCVTCRWLDVCGGNFRVRAEAATGDIWGEDLACYLTAEERA